MRSALCACLLLLSSACIRQTPPIRLNDAAQVTVAYVVDSDESREVTEPPDEVKAAIEAELSKRNLVPVRVPFAQVASFFEGQRDSARRYAHLKTLATSTPLVLLVELKSSFFSQLSGQYRWRVLGKISAGKTAETIDPNADSFEKPVFLLYDHQRGREALITAAPTIGEHVGIVFDGFLQFTGNTTQHLSQRAKDLGLVYFVMVDRFHNGDASNDGAIDLNDPDAFHGGDLKGVLDKLDYLQSFGVKTVWLSPVFKMRTEKFFKYGAYHGYWTYDLNQVEPRFGDEALLRKLSDELHARKMNLVLDLVLNHVGPDAPLVKEKPEWFHRQGAIENWNDPVEVVNKDVHGLPDFAQENEEVYQYLLKASLGWIDRVHPDGFRLDAVKHIPSSFWARFNGDVKKHAGGDFILLGELLEGDAQKLAAAWREGGFTHMFDFPLHFALVDVFCKGAPLSRLSSTLSQDALYPDASGLVTMVDNHDLPRIASACGAKDAPGLRQALALIFAARGSPSITWGTEAGLTGTKEPENRADMKFDTSARTYFDLGRLAMQREKTRTGAPTPLLLQSDDKLLALGWLGDKGGSATAFNVTDVSTTWRVSDELVPMFETEGMVTYEHNPATKVEAHDFAHATLKPTDIDAYRRFLSSVRGGARSLRPVTFKANAPVEAGDALFLVGSADELGAWRPETAKGPFRDGALSTSLAEGLAYEFKLVIRRKDGRTEWEPGNNRALFVPFRSAALAVDLTWGKRNG